MNSRRVPLVTGWVIEVELESRDKKLSERPTSVTEWQHSNGNHLRFGWISTGLLDVSARRFFSTQIGQCEREPVASLGEASAAARLIRENFDSELVLCLSGGVDSECMARAFLRAAVGFRVAIARYQPGNLNEDDIVDAVRFCEANKVEYRFVDIDLVDFFESKKHLDFARRFECRSPQLAVHIELVLRLLESTPNRSLVPVFGGNPIEIGFDYETGVPTLLSPSEPQLCLQRFFMRSGLAGVPFFFSYTPELIYSFLRTEQFANELSEADRRFRLFAAASSENRRFVVESFNGAVSPYLGKVRKYQEGGFSIVAREGKKTGFESAKAFFKARFINTGVIDSVFQYEPFDYFFRRPLEEISPYPKMYAQLLPARFFPRPDLLRRWSGGLT